MNKEIIIENTKKKFNGELLNIVLEQINNYYELNNSNYIIKNNYKIGDNVILNNNNLLHGIGKHYDLLKIFKERGIVSTDFYGENINHAFCYTSAFWIVKNKISLKQYIINYSGMVANYNDLYEQIPYKQLDNFVEKMKNIDHWLWNAESSMEIRFMPSLAKNENQLAFIINTENEIAKKLIKNSVFSNNFNKEHSLEFVNETAKEQFKKNGFTADFFERAIYIIFGIPACLIEGILVGKKYETDKNKLKEIKKLFSNCYICNLDGKVIL